ncbi:TetR family transcriptional regulator [Sphingomonas sp. PP-F2F-A104-K0414]|uniref:TetR/AcrR family transcriptional regulator n=1 Tax=Sphingomonas sp. PP-F2F-A104-K0414 TaxID=2135661 RepID=UPI001044675E|nr:TetR/AcrR family transcriptional regulator [Sphingomonas sp. PP-F2F-A104-K0414]TCQ01021.1 TetR family transcriptional regulator [Sphingomonas sp. PP-F2F-A104-K0414]
MRLATSNSREAVLAAARRSAMARGYNGLNFRDIAAEVGIKAPSIYHHFATKADLGAAVARRYWEDTVAQLAAISDETPDPLEALHRYPEIFRKSLSNDNRICLSSFMAAEYDDLPDPVKIEVQGFADVNVAWLSKLLVDARIVGSAEGETRARAIYAAVAGAQLFARGRSDIALFDTMIDSYRSAGLLPA